MKSILVFALLLSLMPIQVLSHPSPIALTTLVFPACLLLLGIRLTKWTHLTLLVLGYGLIIALLHGMYTSSVHPLLSFLSFGTPLTGILLGLNEGKRNSDVPLFFKRFWVVSLLLAGALLVNLAGNNFVARTSIQTVSDFHGYHSASSVAGSIYGAPMFASFGVNSFAGILISFFFLSVFCIPRANRKVRFILVISSIVILLFGLLLQSRMFFLGFGTFLLVLVIRSGLPTRIRLTLLVTGLFTACAILLFDPRIARFLEVLNESGMTADSMNILTSNRFSIWKDVKEGPNLLIGSAFGTILDAEHASSSFHFYAITALAKGGIFFALPLFIMILRSLRRPRKGGVHLRSENAVINAALWSFVAQSFVWDIFAVQVYGHIAWLFVGLSLSRRYA